MKHQRMVRSTLAISLFVTLLVVAACGSSVQGTYSDPAGAVLVEVRSGSQASITFMGDVAPCTYKVYGNKLALNCKEPAGRIQFTIHDDGSLTGPPGSFFTTLRKTK